MQAGGHVTLDFGDAVPGDFVQVTFDNAIANGTDMGAPVGYSDMRVVRFYVRSVDGPSWDRFERIISGGTDETEFIEDVWTTSLEMVRPARVPWISGLRLSGRLNSSYMADPYFTEGRLSDEGREVLCKPQRFKRDRDNPGHWMASEYCAWAAGQENEELYGFGFVNDQAFAEVWIHSAKVEDVLFLSRRFETALQAAPRMGVRDFGSLSSADKLLLHMQAGGLHVGFGDV